MIDYSFHFIFLLLCKIDTATLLHGVDFTNRYLLLKL